jgi:hypothetical protein
MGCINSIKGLGHYFKALLFMCVSSCRRKVVQDILFEFVGSECLLYSRLHLFSMVRNI